MNKESTKKNFLYQASYEIIILFLPFILSPYISRVIGAKGLGIFSYSYTVGTYFLLVADLGIKNYGNRVIAKVRDSRDKLNIIFSELFILHLVISIIVVFLYILYIFVFAHGDKYALIQIFLVISSVFDISWLYFGIENFKLTVFRNYVIKILTVILIFIFVRASQDLWVYCLIMSLGTLLSQISLWIPLKKYVKIVLIPVHSMQKHLKPLILLFIPAIAVSLYKFLDKIMIAKLASETELGLFDNAEKIISIPIAIIVAFGMVMLPKMSNLLVKTEINTLKKYIHISVSVLLPISIYFTTMLFSIAQNFAPFFWGEEFIKSGILIRYLSITIPFIAFANIIRTQYLIPFEKDFEYIFSVFIGALLNIFTNILLIPNFGAMGAVIGTIFAEISVCIIQIIIVRKDLEINRYLTDLVSYILFSVLIMFILSTVNIENVFLTMFIKIIIGSVLYFCLIMFYLFYYKKQYFLIVREHIIQFIDYYIFRGKIK